MSDTAILQIIGFIIAITVHEAAHAFVAYKCGDTTAYDEGRVSLNPINHVDPFGTVILPVMLLIMNSPFMFGWAKPVPVDPRNLNDPKTDEYWISLAGPLSNFALAAIFGGIVRMLMGYGDGMVKSGVLSIETAILMLKFSAAVISVNLVLGIFNLIPIPPLDGFNVIRSMLPDEIYENLYIPPGIGFLMFIVLMSAGVTDSIISTFYMPLYNLLIGR
ncbi:MAG TPA: site-2 protease family protein [Candidatus Wallbacteria bacterium]|nr:MAG: Peptidase family M50 [bacterium ADurb.Bin243]HOD40385.1 site-2 protease family protein [Candidatus Wallbacteria bacterium]HPG56353.1 site-2 protease family protein [Candidatus Wallbacteria bacterium]